MNQTQFPELTNKWLPKIIDLISKKINGEAETDRKYYFKSMLTPKYSVDLKYGSSSVDSKVVTADVISMDSRVPVKSRGSMQTFYGDIPKQGISYMKGERLLADIEIMKARGASESEIVAELFDDVKSALFGINDRTEAMFLQLLSSGATVVEEDKNTGTAIRAKANYLAQNSFTAATDWGQAGYKPISDIKRMVKAAKKSNPRYAFMSDTAYDLLISSQEAKDLVANGLGLLVTDQSRVPVPSSEVFNEAFRKETKLTIIVIDTVLYAEKNGTAVPFEPFASNAVVLAPSLSVGRLVYGTLPEVNSLRNNPKAPINFEVVDNIILLKRYSETNPLVEITSAEAICMPVIDNVHHIYHLTTDGGSEEGQTEGDSDFVWGGVTYVKAHVIAALAEQGVIVPSDITDADLLTEINKLSTSQKNKLKKAFPDASPLSLDFTNAADSTGKIITVASAGTVTASSSQAFATAAVTGGEVKITVLSNSGAARNAVITITQGGKSIKATVSQEAGE
jgi:hypothetical protein